MNPSLVKPEIPGTSRHCKARIRELKFHYDKRTEEVLSILEKESKNAFQVSSRMSWDVIYDSWDLFPFPQKWFATGEAIARVKYLKHQ